MAGRPFGNHIAPIIISRVLQWRESHSFEAKHFQTSASGVKSTILMGILSNASLSMEVRKRVLACYVEGIITWL